MPFLPETRQYRNFSVSNFRAANDGDGQSYMVDGYFCTFNEPYELFRDYWEEIDPHAFDECDMSDVIMQVNHDGHVFARTRNKSLSLSFDGHGGMGSADLSGSKKGREELYESIRNGLVDRMSFGFTIADDGFEYTVDGEGVYHTRITKVAKLYDISAIEGFPANDGTEISARSLHDGLVEARNKQEELERQAAEAAAEEQRAAEQAEAEQRAAESLALRRRKAKALEFRAIELGYQPA